MTTLEEIGFFVMTLEEEDFSHFSLSALTSKEEDVLNSIEDADSFKQKI
ncbi:hypothetical protein J2Y03_005779 [Neobacillus niacini]|nr:hypothetical protein [Neobacillus niacini]MDR7080688.1 hypothetical protein [Neobacillus niacini]